MRPEQARAVRDAPREVTPELVAHMWKLFASDHDERGPAATRVLRGLGYGPDERQRLDLHVPAHGFPGGPRPVLMFLPGGGFVAGNRHTPGTPYYDHVGRWAVEHGMLGVTIDYRLAPAHTWPAGAEDAAAAVALVRETVGDHGGDPDRIVVAGHSAGAAHVAGLLAGHGGPVPSGIVGAALLSGLYDLDGAAEDPLMSLYFGADAVRYPGRSALPGLLDVDVPLLLAFAELDPPLFHDQLARFVAAHHRRHGRLPAVTCAVGHNHVSEIVSLGLPDDPLGDALAAFVAPVTGPGAAGSDATPLAPVLVGGQVLATPALPVTNPARVAETVGHCALGGPVEADAAVAAALTAFPAWAALDVRERAQQLLRVADALEPGTARRADLLVREVGKVRGEAMGDAAGAVTLLRYFASLADELGEVFGSGAEVRMPLAGQAAVRQVPMGPVVVIAPWNTPVYLTFMALGPALLAGNTVVVKPPEEAPLALTDALRVLAAALPVGVLGVVPGLGAVAGPALTGHPAVRKVLFTGSIETGKAVMRSAAGHLAGVSMELGGNDAAVLLDDVVIDDALLRELAGGVFALSGQVCYNVKRIYVHESRIAEFVQKFGAAADRLVVGDPGRPETTIGPVTTRAGRDRLAALVADCRAVGATVTEVGRVPDAETFAAGNYVHPAIVTGLPVDHELVVTEQFGPIVPVLPFRTDDEAVALANATEYGLAASVWSADRARAHALARRLEAGSVFVNVHRVGASPMTVPFGGVKQSGIGRTHGVASVLACTEAQAVIELDDPAELPGAAHWAVLTLGDTPGDHE